MPVGQPKHPPSKSGIKSPEIPDQLLSFSFRHLDIINNEKFRPSAWQYDLEGLRNYLSTMLDRLKNLSGLKWTEVATNRSPALRAHPINWDDTSEEDGFAHLNTQLREHQPYQFQLTANAHGRVHGFQIDGVFYVVWLDPEHRLYPGAD